MEHSLSTILPVRNVERQLERQVHGLIEIVAELTDDIEILIVDDGSTDNTEEIAVELCRTYPQLDVVRHSSPLGITAATNVGIERTTGEVILVHNIQSPVSDDAIRRLWSMRDVEDLLAVRPKEAHNPLGQAATGSLTCMGTKLLRRTASEFESSRSPVTISDLIIRTDAGATSRASVSFQPMTGISTPVDR